MLITRLRDLIEELCLNSSSVHTVKKGIIKEKPQRQVEGEVQENGSVTIFPLLRYLQVRLKDI